MRSYTIKENHISSVVSEILQYSQTHFKNPVTLRIKQKIILLSNLDFAIPDPYIPGVENIEATYYDANKRNDTTENKHNQDLIEALRYELSIYLSVYISIYLSILRI